MMQIEDGKGSGYKAEISAENKLQVTSVSIPVLLHVMRAEGQAYVWNFTGYDYDGADTVMFLRNDSDEPLYISHIFLYSDTATKVQVHLPSNPTTPAGTAITGINLNRGSGRVANVTAYQDETGNTQGNVCLTEYIAQNQTLTMMKEDSFSVLLGKNDCIGVDLVTAGTMAYGHIVGYYSP